MLPLAEKPEEITFGACSQRCFYPDCFASGYNQARRTKIADESPNVICSPALNHNAEAYRITSMRVGVR